MSSLCTFLIDWLFKQKLFSNVQNTSFDMTPFLSKSLKNLPYFFDLTSQNLSSKSFLHRFCILCYMSQPVVKSQNMSKLSLIHLTHKAGPAVPIRKFADHRCEHGFFSTDRVVTNQPNARFFKEM